MSGKKGILFLGRAGAGLGKGARDRGRLGEGAREPARGLGVAVAAGAGAGAGALLNGQGSPRHRQCGYGSSIPCPPPSALSPAVVPGPPPS